MMDAQKHLENLNEIKRIMERSTRFLSLSGLAGVFAGTFALIGAYLAYQVLDKDNFINGMEYFDSKILLSGNHAIHIQLISIAIGVLVLSLGAGFYFTHQKAKKENRQLWTVASKKMLLSLLAPLISGGILCLLLINQGLFVLVAPITLIFYGLSCINASTYTHSEIGAIGYFNILLGLLNVFFLGYGLLFWVLGFGFLHIIYGTLMYLKYEKE